MFDPDVPGRSGGLDYPFHGENHRIESRDLRLRAVDARRHPSFLLEVRRGLGFEYVEAIADGRVDTRSAHLNTMVRFVAITNAASSLDPTLDRSQSCGFAASTLAKCNLERIGCDRWNGQRIRIRTAS